MTAIVPTKFYAAKMCPYAQRVSISLYELGLLEHDVNHYTQETQASGNKLDVVFIDLTNKPDWYLKDVNPEGKVPVIEITSASGTKELLTESIPLAELVLQSHDYAGALIKPEQAHLRYKAGIIIGAVNSQIIANFYALLREKNEAEQPKVAAKLIDGIKHVQSLLSPKGPYAMGEQFTIADILCAPILARFNVIEHWRKFTVPRTEEFALFNKWSYNLVTRGSVKNTLAEPEFLFEAYKKFTV